MNASLFEIGALTAGDWPYLYQETIKTFWTWPSPWGYNYSGMGGASYASGLVYFFEITAKILSSLGLDWVLIERLIWFGPILLLTFFGSLSLAKKVLPSKTLFQWFAPIVYSVNTYFLMLVSGGQLGVAFGYSLGPLILKLFIDLPEHHSWRHQLTAGLLFGWQMLLEPRIFLLTIVAILGYYFLVGGVRLITAGKILLFPLLVVLVTNLFWLWPSLTIRGGALPVGYGASGWVSFFSFADFSDTISLLHPNWPENIFGKTYLMRPEFLALPILSFASLLFINYSRVDGSPAGRAGLTNSVRNKSNPLINNRTILYFNLLALLGAFLAKGANPPFGRVYLWLFEHLPGMRLFRDPTKFYFWVAIAYSIMIPFSLQKISLKSKLFKR